MRQSSTRPLAHRRCSAERLPSTGAAIRRSTSPAVRMLIRQGSILAARFAELFDGFSIGSNDLTQLTLGVDRDSDVLAPLFDERDAAVEWSIRRLIDLAHTAGAPVGLCGQRPSDDPDFARTLVRLGIDSISVTPDSLLAR